MRRLSIRGVVAGLLLAAVLIAAICWAASPWFAFQAFRAAAVAGDRDGLAAVVDYPALRASLAPQVRARLEARRAEERAQAERERAAQPPTDNRLVEFGRRLFDRLDRSVEDARAAAATVQAPLRLDGELERSLTPEALAEQADARIERFAYVSPSRVQVTVADADRGPLFVMERVRPFDWRLVHLRYGEVGSAAASRPAGEPARAQ